LLSQTSIRKLIDFDNEYYVESRAGGFVETRQTRLIKEALNDEESRKFDTKFLSLFMLY
jgi:hypothetical protein